MIRYKPSPPPKWLMLTLKLQAKDYELNLLHPPHKSKSDPYPNQSQDQSLFQAEHIRLMSCSAPKSLIPLYFPPPPIAGKFFFYLALQKPQNCRGALIDARC